MKEKWKIKILALVIIIGLFLSGLTAIPLVSETVILHYFFGDSEWMQKLISAIYIADQNFPSAFYGTDWLAFAHFLLAFLFIGLFRDPLKNEWLITFGIVASVAILPYAFIFGYFRGIPIWWRCIDCTFGVVAFLIFYKIHLLLNKLKSQI